MALVNTAKRLRCICHIYGHFSFHLILQRPFSVIMQRQLKFLPQLEPLRVSVMLISVILRFNIGRNLTSVRILKVHMSQNPADLWTKALNRKHTRHLLRHMGYYRRQSSNSNNNLSLLLPTAHITDKPAHITNDPSSS